MCVLPPSLRVLKSTRMDDDDNSSSNDDDDYDNHVCTGSRHSQTMHWHYTVQTYRTIEILLKRVNDVCVCVCQCWIHHYYVCRWIYVKCVPLNKSGVWHDTLSQLLLHTIYFNGSESERSVLVCAYTWNVIAYTCVCPQPYQTLSLWLMSLPRSFVLPLSPALPLSLTYINPSKGKKTTRIISNRYLSRRFRRWNYSLLIYL